MIKPIELGCPGHFIGAASCEWRRHTQVGKYRVSTIGDYNVALKHGGVELRKVGGDLYESMVFETTDQHADESDCGCMEVVSFSAIETAHYSTPGAANAGHEALVAKYLAIAQGKRHDYHEIYSDGGALHVVERGGGADGTRVHLHLDGLCRSAGNGMRV